MRKLIGTGVIVVLALGMVGCSDEAEEAEDTVRGAVSTIADKVEDKVEQASRLTTTLSGPAEVPTAGDPDGTGTATVNLNIVKGELCYEVTVQKLDPPVAMHIHEAERGKSGDIVVPLTTPTGGDTTTTGCANPEATLIARMAARPGDFYVNVHTQTYPQGAARGQLSQ
ncbi:MAG TPA: CHRD domain-containing protein [Acidimicrobiales bacterium]|nr:CHRD domain-containing protein [Acidimicrobiales bacterium]